MAVLDRGLRSDVKPRTFSAQAAEKIRHPTSFHGAWVRSDATRKSAPSAVSYVNTTEGSFSRLKRGINGVYHHVGEKHLAQYLGEFDFRYNTRILTDVERTIEGIRKAEGKRMMLRRPKRAS